MTTTTTKQRADILANNRFRCAERVAIARDSFIEARVSHQIAREAGRPAGVELAVRDIAYTEWMSANDALNAANELYAVEAARLKEEEGR